MTSQQTLSLLRKYESPNVTFIDPDGSWPIVWARARGMHVWDADGKKYLDLTAAFGVAATGHANPRVVKAGQRQMQILLHAMGDVHPHELKARLARELSRITFERWSKMSAGKGGAPTLSGKTIFCNSGFESVEAALKTAMLATGKPGVIAFQGGYHGLGYGALTATHRKHFRAPFEKQLGNFGCFLPYPAQPSEISKATDAIAELLQGKQIGAVLLEPIQVRGGINIPPAQFLPRLREVCNEHRALLILDEVYTGFGRTGKCFACEHWETVPDLVCLGKALTGGFPLSACVGRADIMDAAWPRSTGEAIHTSTFLGHPVGCAMALAQIKELEQRGLIEHSAQLGRVLLKQLTAHGVPALAGSPLGPHGFGDLSRKPTKAGTPCVRGVGLLVGVELRKPDASPDSERALRIIKAMLRRGFIMLPEGEHGNVLSFTPPLIISQAQITTTLKTLQTVLAEEK
jgi:4-aminobutyrate aminotransferase-like enzyme